MIRYIGITLTLSFIWLNCLADDAIQPDWLYAKNYQEYKKEPEMKKYVWGVFRGISAANASLIGNNMQPLYCPPLNKQFTRIEIEQLLEKSISFFEPAINNPDAPPFFIEYALLLALKNEYSCSEHH